MSIANINKFETTMKEHEEVLNTKMDTKIDDLKAEASSSINQTFYTLNSHESNYYYNQPSDDINKCPFLKSPDFHSHASQFTKHLSPMTLECDTPIQLKKNLDAVCYALCQSLSTNKS